MTSVKLMLNKSRALRDGRYPVVFQLIHDRNKKLIYTSFRLREGEFDPDRNKVCFLSERIRSKEEVRLINDELDRQQMSIDRHIAALELRREPYTTSEVVFRYRTELDGLSLLGYMDLQIRKRMSSDRFGSAAGLRNTRASVRAFTGCRVVHVNEVNGSFVRQYEEWLLRRGVRHNTVRYYMRNLRTVYNQAVLDGHVEPQLNPFLYLRTKIQRTIKRALDRDALRSIAEKDFSAHAHLELARDLFLFSFYCRGMPFVDVIYLRKSEIHGGVLSYQRHKTGQRLSVAVTSRMEEIIRKYDSPSSYVFPILEDGRSKEWLYHRYRIALDHMNRNLKRVGRLCGIDTPLTTLVARHSWATLARNTGAPVAVISEGLGHTSEKTTRIYLKEFDHSVLDQVNEMVTLL